MTKNSKLTALYGEPHSYFDENMSTTTNCSVWIGSDGTAVYLRHYQFKARDSESVILCYGLQTFGDAFLKMKNRLSPNQSKEKTMPWTASLMIILDYKKSAQAATCADQTQGKCKHH